MLELAAFFLASAKQALDHATEIFQLAPDEPVHQVRLRFVDRAVNAKVHAVIPRLFHRLEIVADRAKQLAPDLVVDR